MVTLPTWAQQPQPRAEPCTPTPSPQVGCLPRRQVAGGCHGQWRHQAAGCLQGRPSPNGGARHRWACAWVRPGGRARAKPQHAAGGGLVVCALARLRPAAGARQPARPCAPQCAMQQAQRGPPPAPTCTAGDTHKRASAIRGEVKCMAFTRAGTHLALGCTYGGLTVLAWPSLDVVFELRCGQGALGGACRRGHDALPRPATCRAMHARVEPRQT